MAIWIDVWHILAAKSDAGAKHSKPKASARPRTRKKSSLALKHKDVLRIAFGKHLTHLQASKQQTYLFLTVAFSDGIHLDWCCQMNLQLCIQIQHLIATRVTGVTSMSSNSKMDKLALNKKILETELLKTRLACIEAGCNLADS